MGSGWVSGPGSGVGTVPGPSGSPLGRTSGSGSGTGSSTGGRLPPGTSERCGPPGGVGASRSPASRAAPWLAGPCFTSSGWGLMSFPVPAEAPGMPQPTRSGENGAMSAPQPPYDGPPVVAVVGSTAAGKTSLSLDLAEELGGEVINTDAFQLYRGMDIGTAKVPVDERRGIAHHLLDVLDITDTATVAEVQQWARAAVADVRGRGLVPVLVGGSALYTRAVVDDFTYPGTDPAVRRRLTEELEERGVAAMYARLAEVDPAAAAHIEPANDRRIVR